MLRAFSLLVMTTLVASLAWAAQTLSGPAPGFSLESSDGQQVSLASLKGKVVMVHFWATWCVPCRQEMPHLLAVNVEKDNAAGARKWLEETPVTFPVLFDPKSDVTKLYKVQTMPSTVLVGRDGTMRFIHHGYKPGYEAEYQTLGRALLRE